MSIRKVLDVMEDWLSGVLLVGGLALLFIGVIARYIVEKPIFWADEVAGYLVVWGALLGTGVALREGKHIRVHMLYDVLNPTVKKMVGLFVNLLGIGFCVFVVYGGVILEQKYLTTGQMSLNAQIPLWLPYLVAPLSGVVFGRNFLFELYDLFKNK